MRRRSSSYRALCASRGYARCLAIPPIFPPLLLLVALRSLQVRPYSSSHSHGRLPFSFLARSSPPPSAQPLLISLSPLAHKQDTRPHELTLTRLVFLSLSLHSFIHTPSNTLPLTLSPFTFYCYPFIEFIESNTKIAVILSLLIIITLSSRRHGTSVDSRQWWYGVHALSCGIHRPLPLCDRPKAPEG